MLALVLVSYGVANERLDCKQPNHEAQKEDISASHASAAMNLILADAIKTGHEEKAKQKSGTNQNECAFPWTVVRSAEHDSTGFFTVVLCYVVFLQFIWLTRQEKVLTDSIELSRDEFIATHRPRIVVRDVSIDYIGETEEDKNMVEVKIDYSIANTGDTPAMIRMRNATLVLTRNILVNVANANTLPARPKYDVMHNIVEDRILDGGESITRTHTQEMNRTDWGMLHTSMHSGFVVGFIRYEDKQKRRFLTAFCRLHDRVTNRCFVAESADYEYQD